jgi:AraC-like DNA-binding protein
MDIFIKCNYERTYQVLIREQLERHEIDFDLSNSGCIKLDNNICRKKYDSLVESLKHYGIDIVDNHKAIMVQKIKDAVRKMLHADNGMPLVKISSYLSESLGESYRTLSSLFSEVCHISIESFIIFHKIELVKQLLLTDKLTLTEISHKLQYSSVAHLSNQFKNITGFSPSVFQKITQTKRAMLN